jgi:hypothetical protein
MSRRLVLVLAALALAVVVLWSAFSNGPGPAGVTARNTAVDLAQATDEGASPLVPVSAEAPGDERTPAVVEDSPPRATAESAREWSGRLHGRLFHARTQAPLAGIQIDYTAPPGVDERMTTDEYGWFVSSQSLPQGTLSLRAVDPITGDLLAEKRHEHRPKPIPKTLNGEPQLWPLDIGPGFVVDLLGAEGVEGPWKLRVLERPLAVEQRAWEWIDAVLGPEPNQVMARYPPLSAARDRIERGWIEVRNAAETHSGEERLLTEGFLFRTAVTLGPIRGSLRGRVVDGEGRPVPSCVAAISATLPSIKSTRWPSAQTAPDGSYSLPGVLPGPTQVFVTSDHRAAALRSVEVSSGRETLLDVTLETLGPLGDIQGELVATATSPPIWALLSLISKDSGKTSRSLVVDGRDSSRAPFRFDAVPLGDYSLEVFALDGRLYEPTRREVKVPSEGVQIESLGAAVEDIDRLVRLRARDRVDGAQLDPMTWALRIGSYWWPAVFQGSANEAYLSWPTIPEHSPAEIVLTANGHLPLVRPLTDVQATKSGPVLDFELARGNGPALVVLDAEPVLGGSDGWNGYGVFMRGLEGARVQVGGRTLAVSDAHGLALVESQEPIGDFDVVLPGWRVLTVHCFHGDDRLRDGLGFVLMLPD